jgi:membrane-bound serine protease (ClpP class)
MRRSLLSFSLLAGLLLSTLATAGVALAQTDEPVAAEPPAIDVIKVDGPIDGVLLGYLEDRLDDAVAENAVVVLQLDSPGTMGQDGVELGDRLVSLPVPVLVWTGPVPAKASGAGMLLLYAASLPSVAPGSQTGPLRPVDMLRPDDVPPDMDASIDAWLAARDRTGVRREFEQEAMNAQQAIDRGFAEIAATSVPDLLAQADGRTVQTAAGPVKLRTRIATEEGEPGVSIRFIEPGPIQRVEHAISTPSMVYFLLLVALACLAFELTQPGFGFAGFAGLGLLAMAVYGIVVVPPSWIGLALVLAGVGLAVLDLRMRRLGWVSALGLVCLVAGSVLIYGGVAPAVRISPWLIAGMAVGSVLYYGFGLTVAVQSRDRILATQRGLIGLIGEARGRLAPDGPVHVKGAMWRGRAVGEDPIPSGAKVRVRGVDGLVLRVEAEPDGDDDDALAPADGSV